MKGKVIFTKEDEKPLKCPYGFTSADKMYKPLTWFKIIKAIFVKIK
jgi:hypothetical protein